MKTIQEWFNELEEPYKSRAIANTHPSILIANEDRIIDALTGAFNWESSKEGFMFWNNLVKSIIDKQQ